MPQSFKWYFCYSTDKISNNFTNWFVNIDWWQCYGDEASLVSVQASNKQNRNKCKPYINLMCAVLILHRDLFSFSFFPLHNYCFSFNCCYYCLCIHLTQMFKRFWMCDELFLSFSIFMLNPIASESRITWCLYLCMLCIDLNYMIDIKLNNFDGCIYKMK